MLVVALAVLGACADFYEEVELAREPEMAGYPISKHTVPWTIWRNESGTELEDMLVSYNQTDGSIRIARRPPITRFRWYTQVIRPLELVRAREYELCVRIDAGADAGQAMEMSVDLAWPTWRVLAYAWLPFPLDANTTSTCVTFTAPERQADSEFARVVLNLGAATDVVWVRSLELRRCASALDANATEAAAPLPPKPVTELVWSDEFNWVGGVDESKWAFDVFPSGEFNDELQAYTREPANSFVRDGALSIVATCLADARGSAYNVSSARISTRGMGFWGPGHRFDVRARFPMTLGTWPAIWLLPENYTYGDWPLSGEIDIAEHVGCTQGQVLGVVHTEAYNSTAGTQAVGHAYPRPVSAWHQYTLEWLDDGLRFFVNGEQYFSFEREHGERAWRMWPFDQEFHLMINLAVGGQFGGFCLEQGEALPCPEGGVFSRFDIDYVRVSTLREFSPPPPPAPPSPPPAPPSPPEPPSPPPYPPARPPSPPPRPPPSPPPPYPIFPLFANPTSASSGTRSDQGGRTGGQSSRAERKPFIPDGRWAPTTRFWSIVAGSTAGALCCVTLCTFLPILAWKRRYRRAVDPSSRGTVPALYTADEAAAVHSAEPVPVDPSGVLLEPRARGSSSERCSSAASPVFARRMSAPLSSRASSRMETPVFGARGFSEVLEPSHEPSEFSEPTPPAVQAGSTARRFSSPGKLPEPDQAALIEIQELRHNYDPDPGPT